MLNLKENEEEQKDARFWWAMGLTIFFVFNLALMYFDQQPNRAFHALKRPNIHFGIFFYWTHYLLELSFLAMGVS